MKKITTSSNKRYALRPISSYKRKLEQQLRIDSKVSPIRTYRTANTIGSNYEIAGLLEDARAYYQIAANAYFLHLEQIDWENDSDAHERGDKFFRAATLFWKSEESSYETFFKAALGYYRQGYELENTESSVACYHGGATCQLILGDVPSALSAAIMAYQFPKNRLTPLTEALINVIHNYHTNQGSTYSESKMLYENLVSGNELGLSTKDLFSLSIVIDFWKYHNSH